MENIFWTGYSNDDRQVAIIKIRNIVSTYGDIVDFYLFSDISMSLKIEIEESKIDNLYEALSRNIGVKEFKFLNSNSTTERTIFLNITFAKGTGYLKNEMPDVPG